MPELVRAGADEDDWLETRRAARVIGELAGEGAGSDVWRVEETLYEKGGRETDSRLERVSQVAAPGRAAPGPDDPGRRPFEPPSAAEWSFHYVLRGREGHGLDVRLLALP